MCHETDLSAKARERDGFLLNIQGLCNDLECRIVPSV
jgi:hypothetical protein